MKTNCWFNRNRFLSHLRIAPAGTFISAAAAVVLLTTLPAPSAYAEDHQFTIVYQITDIQPGVPDANHVTFTLIGKGLSMILGQFRVTATAVTPLPQHDCDNTYADLTITTGDGGTILIHEEDLNCYTQIIGLWWVTGGTLGASGSGTTRGTGATRSINGRLVIDYAGSLSLN
jgi:hypothetical protein